jgi:hypothetical protein
MRSATAPKWHPIPPPEPVPAGYGRLFWVSMTIVGIAALIVITATA